jgi:hypothetical protein
MFGTSSLCGELNHSNCREFAVVLPLPGHPGIGALNGNNDSDDEILATATVRKTAMKPATSNDCSDLETLTSVIARSPIVVAEPAEAVACLPAGFGQVDIAILHWIVAEGRHGRRTGYLTN